MKILVTGAAGFIGYHLSNKLLSKNYKVIGIDNINDYYDIKLKKKRVQLLKNKNFRFYKLDLKNKKKLYNVFKKHKFDYVVNLAAQAGVRYSLVKPQLYIDNNITTFLNILECCKDFNIRHLVYASTSSVYGLNKNMPFSEDKGSNHPTHIYAATKKCNEMMAHSYSYLYNLPTSGLRFFTVYGPWGRPDMALFKFTKNILLKKNIQIYNYGNHARDFTYVDDIIDGILKIIKKPPKRKNYKKFNFTDNSVSSSPFRILNIGRGKKISLMKYVNLIENTLNIKAKIKFLPKQKGDVQETFSNVKKLSKFGYKPKTDVKVGIKNFIEWYKNYYKINY
tara:strand:+ start:59 stop:1066 length:1008 start_codon:yes stop_codon:yes gene_type:complete